MAVTPGKDISNTYTETIQEIMKTYKSLPPRPTIEEVEAAISVIKTVNMEEKQKLDEISTQICPEDTPPELFSILKKVRQTMVMFQSQEQKKEAMHVVEFDQIYQTFDDLIQRASKCVSGDTQLDKEDGLKYPGGNQLDKDDDLQYPVGNLEKVVISDESLLNSRKISKVESFKGLIKSSSIKATIFPTG
ncbi:hypothetical protein Hanom_Chr03g00260701 [Helianthus anomalus]